MLTYKVIGVQEEVEQRWTQYTAALLSFSIFGFLLVYLIQRVQGFLPFNPQGFGAGNVSPDLAFNTATSFITNTNWQAYSGESTLSYFVQMAALTVQNFASAAAGIAVAIALIRGFARQEKKTIGNFWVDVTRATVYVLLPISIIAALLFCVAGRDSELASVHDGRPRWKARSRSSRKGRWPRRKRSRSWAPTAAASSMPTPRIRLRIRRRSAILLQMFLIFVIPAGLTYTFGKMVGDTRQGWAIFAAFSVMFLVGVFVCYHFEQAR